MAKATGKVASALARLRKAKDENKTLQKAGAAIKRVNTEENRKMLMVGSVAAAAGAAAGYKAQEYLEAIPEGGTEPPVPASVAVIGETVPLASLVGLTIAGYGAFKLKGQAQAAVAGFGGGMAGGAFVHQMAKE